MRRALWIGCLACVGCTKTADKPKGPPPIEVAYDLDRLSVDGKQVLTLRDGRVPDEHISSGGFFIDPLFPVLEGLMRARRKAAAIEQEKIDEKSFMADEPLPPGARFATMVLPSDEITVQAHPHTSFEQLTRVMFTAGQAGFESMRLRTTAGKRSVTVDMPAIGAPPPGPDDLNLVLTITDQAYTLNAAAPLPGGKPSLRFPVGETPVECTSLAGQRPQPRARNRGRPACTSGRATFWTYDERSLQRTLMDIRVDHPKEHRIVVAAEPQTDFEAIARAVELCRVYDRPGQRRRPMFETVVLSPGLAQ